MEYVGFASDAAPDAGSGRGLKVENNGPGASGGKRRDGSRSEPGSAARDENGFAGESHLSQLFRRSDLPGEKGVTCGAS